MPRYVYECPRCKVTTEADRKVVHRDTDSPACVECKSPMVRIPATSGGPFPGADSWRN